MITGTIAYKCDGKKYIYDVEGFDTSETFSFYMSSANYNAVTMMGMDEAGYVDEDELLWERSVEIKLGKINVQTNITMQEVNGKQKKVKSHVNADLFCKLAALFRFVKSQCKQEYSEDYTGLQLASGEFEAQTERTYIIPFPMDSNTRLAKIKLSFGSVVALSCETDDFVINLDTDRYVEDRVFTRPKDAWSSGFMFNRDYLSFDLKPQVIVQQSSSDGMYHTIEEIIEAHPDKEFSWLLKKDYRIVTDDTLQEVCDYIMSWDGYVYYDTETTGLNINFLSRTGQADQLVGVVLSVKFGESFYFPLQMKHIPNLCGGDHWYCMEHYLRPILEGKDLVVHNLSFDWKVAYIYGINCNIVHDTMAILELTYAEEIKDYKVGLKNNAKLLLNRDSLELSDLIIDNSWGENDIKFWDLPADCVRLYACADTDNTNGLLGYLTQNDILGKYGAHKVYEIEIAFAYAVGYQEFYGHHIDVSNLDKIREELGKEQNECMLQMIAMVGHEFNPNSPVQLRTVMYKELGIPEQVSRKTGKVTTDKDTLKKLAEITDAEDNIKYPFCVLMQKFRELEGVRKIVDKFPEHMTQDGYLFSSVKQYGTTTGRVSITSPNYQSYNDPIKKNVIPRPGFWMFDTDYSSVEYRVLGNMVSNKRIMESFEDPDFDYHTYQAAHMYNVPYAAVTKKLRKAAKGINFGLPYGMGDESLGVRVFGEASEENTRKAAALRSAYFKGQEDIRDWFEHHRDKGVNLGYTETYFGRRRYYRRSDFSVNAIRRQAGNQVIQGCQSLDTKILTKEFGIVELGDVLGLNVTVWNGVKWSNGDVLPAGNKRKTIIKFKGGQVKVCSPNHKFLVSTKRGGTMWVEAQNLHTVSEYKNPHRIVVNQQYALADYVYKSDRVYDSVSNNANNAYLDDIGDSYKIGIYLGRLASDGHQTLSHSGSNCLIQIVAEHEFNILDELRDCMKNFHYTEDNAEVREDRNEALTRLNVYSTSLSREVDDLDIRHKIHKNIFSDTELLRGFLCGYFDGDGGVSGKTITCVFGKQDNFDKLVTDMQVALSFFGVRSRIREYDDRYVLQVKTNDNEIFLKEIGFLNQNKQIAGSRLHCIEEEKTFGKCIIAESVEVTDEWIPMADVCNTDDGYYVADGIITHNTAADIYKTAVGRVFKRICHEGWLGKVLFDGFIHDELLGEVSNDINPGVWLRILREEFEVKVYNDDGSPWCPLYMGFGYGMSWYEAKSVELPIKLQWELVDKYGEAGFPNWDGNGRKFCDSIPDMLRDFEVRDITNQITAEENQGKEIKPALNSALLDCVKTDAKLYAECISDYITESDDYMELQGGMSLEDYLSCYEDGICKFMNERAHISCLYRDPETGKPVDSFEQIKTTQGSLDQFCILHGVDRSKVNLLDIEEATSSAPTVLDANDEDDYDNSVGNRLQQIKDNRIDMLGIFMDTNEMTITLQVVPKQYMDFIRSKTNREGKGYKVMFKDTNGLVNSEKVGAVYSTEVYLPSDEVSVIQTMYLQYLKR